MSKYIQQFFELKCAPDILARVGNIKNMEKEITESFSIISTIRYKLISNPGKFTIVDLCAGNALTSILIAHMFKCKSVIAVDINPSRASKEKRLDGINGFKYIQADITKHLELIDTLNLLEEDVIFISSHPCERANDCVDIYTRLKFEREWSDGEKFSNFETYICVIPCCRGKYRNKIPSLVSSKLGRYLTWCYDLSISGNNLHMKVDNHMLSPCNCLIHDIE